MFDIGGLAAMLNTHLIDDTSKPKIRFRIIGRQAFYKATDSKMGGLKRPKTSWSIFIGMGLKRIDKSKVEPIPVDVFNPNILENFKKADENVCYDSPSLWIQTPIFKIKIHYKLKLN